MVYEYGGQVSDASSKSLQMSMRLEVADELLAVVGQRTWYTSRYLAKFVNYLSSELMTEIG